MTRNRELSILLVDDHLDGANSLAEALRVCGYNPHVVSTSKEALVAVNEKMPDVLISDIGLPHRDGCELALRIAALDCEMPLMIALAGFQNLRDRCRVAGFDHFFLKPAEPNEIIALIKNRP